ncbi:MAG: FtsW/RodA/SpoVE family cell cycle protein, partial [Anaerolineales bacterium]
TLTNLVWGHWIGFLVWLILFSRLELEYNKLNIKKDRLLLPIISMMSGWGLLTVWRLTPRLGIKQSIWFSISLILIIIGLHQREKVLIALKKYKYVWLVSGLFLTALTFIWGTNPSNLGPKLWLGCCGIYLQPAEPLKLLLILYLAAYFADQQPFSQRLLPLITPTAIMAGLTLMILIFQKDLGTAFIFITIYAGMIYSATSKKEVLILSSFIIGLGLIIGYYLFDVVQLRVDAWINPWQDPSGRSFQIVQSLISVAAGGMTGRGPGMGYPNLVPVAYSDFAGQAILIIGGNIRMLTLTGVTLPFFSYCGSSLLTSFLAFFLLITINQHTTEKISLPKRPTPIVHLLVFFLAGYTLLAGINGWWSIYRGPELIDRTDNARRTISDQYNKRGEILDRNSSPLSYTEGSPGDYVRVYTYPEFSNVVGYTQPFYGQVGIESSLDPILRGLDNQSPWNTWYFHLLYGQSPPGLNVKLTLDTNLQLLAAQYLQNTPGAIVLLNSQNGEILVLYSSPYFNANELDSLWESLQTDPSAPLLNRAVQSLYPPGPSLAPFLIAQTSSFGNLTSQITSLNSNLGGKNFICTKPTSLPATWGIVGKAGCPGPLEFLGDSIGAEELENLFLKLGFYDTPNIQLNLSPPFIPEGITSPSKTSMGQGDILTTPLQMALAATTISNQGNRPDPKIILASQDYQGKWNLDQNSQPLVSVFSQSSANKTAEILQNNNLPIWETTAFALTETGAIITWYIGGSLPEENMKYTVVVTLEREDVDLAKIIGQRLLTAVKTP